jgi:hypothetical protein
MFAININGCAWLLSSTRKGNTDISVFRFAWAIDDATHDRHLEFFHSRILLNERALLSDALVYLGPTLENCWWFGHNLGRL